MGLIYFSLSIGGISLPKGAKQGGLLIRKEDLLVPAAGDRKLSGSVVAEKISLSRPFS